MEIPAAEFKSKCLKLMDKVAKTREPIIVTKHGKPVAKIVPIEPEHRQSHFGYMEGTAKITGDIVAPTALPWSVITGDEDHLYQSVKGDNQGK